MGTESIETIIEKLDGLERNTGRLFDMVEQTAQKIDELHTVKIKNGGGRMITFLRSEFDQMLYDRPKEQFTQITDTAKRLNQFADLVWKLASVAALVFTAIKLGS